MGVAQRNKARSYEEDKYNDRHTLTSTMVQYRYYMTITKTGVEPYDDFPVSACPMGCMILCGVYLGRLELSSTVSFR